MKLLLILLLTSCSTIPYTRTVGRSNSDRIEQCVYRLIEKSGIDAKTAQESCSKIFRR